jgi:hypothetical protein
MAWTQRSNSGNIYESNSMGHGDQTKTHQRIRGPGSYHNELDVNDK